jgi:hypothetical protein
MAGYRLAVANTVTGQIVGDLPYVGTPTWSRVLNGAGTLTGVSVPLDSPLLDADMRQRLREPWRWTLVWALGGAVLQAGILTDLTVDDTQKPAVAALTTATLWEFLSRKRLVVTPGQGIGGAGASVLFGPSVPDASNQNLSLHSVARRLVKLAMTADSTYALPIILPAPIAGSRVRTYVGADLATTGARLSELTQVDQGPEVEFAPEWVDSTQGYVQWRMRIGNTRLGQLGYPHAFDYQRALRSLSVGVAGAAMTFSVTAKGNDSRSTDTAGTVTGILLSAVAGDSTYTGQGWPALQTADTSHTSVIDATTLQGYATALVTRDKLPTRTATAVIANDGLDTQGRATGSPSIDLISTGDTAVLGMYAHPFLPDGQYAVRVLTLESGPDAYHTKMVLQVIT